MGDDASRLRQQAAWGLLVDLTTTVLPAADGVSWPDARRPFLAEAQRVAPLLGAAGSEVVDVIRAANRRLAGDESDREAWTMLDGLRAPLEKLAAVALPACPFPPDGVIEPVYGMGGKDIAGEDIDSPGMGAGVDGAGV